MWKTIKEFPMYEISPNGLIRNKTNQRIKKPSIGSRGYPVVSLQREGKQYLRTVHILLARAFIDNPRNCEQVNHIYGNKLNYDLSNLEWCTRSENIIHSYENGLQKNVTNPHGTYKVLTKSQLNIIRGLHELGFVDSKIAECIGCTRGLVSRKIRGMKLR